MIKSKQAFTLIELLVVVLIIGILAAVALPQYQKSVEKSRAAQAITLVKALAQAAQVYYMENGTYPPHINQLNIGLSAQQQAELWCPNGIQYTCNKKEWGVFLYHSAVAPNLDSVIVLRTSGPYKGGGFIIYTNKPTAAMEAGQLYCYERTTGPNAISQVGDYCKKLWGGTRVGQGGNAYQYELP